MQLVTKTLRYMIIIGLVGLIISWIFGLQETLVTQYTFNGVTGYRINIQTYLANLSNARSSDALNFQNIIPSREMDTNGWNWGNNLLVVMNWLYFPINFLLYIVRWLAWLIVMALALIGWPVGKNQNGDYISTLADILNFVIENLFIPYL